MEFLSSNLPLILFFLAGFGLLLTEAFMPGFGIAGILGIVLEILAVYSVWLHYGLVPALIFTLVVLALIGLTVFLSYRSAMKGRLSKSDLVLKDAQHPESDQARKTLAPYVGREGIAVTPLRPAGQIEVDGVRMNAAGGGEFIEKGTRVHITGTEGDHVLVRSADSVP